MIQKKEIIFTVSFQNSKLNTTKVAKHTNSGPPI